jgi:fermentation-respiration switch protein FrsA (DUF1100 family)
MEKVSFPSAGVSCAAWLGIPARAAAGERCPAIVMGHGFGAVKEALLVEAEHLTAAGFITLAIDYRSFGESGGDVRGNLFPNEEVEDYRNAISWLQARADVDPERIGIWGMSFGGGIVIQTAAMDRRVKAVVSVVPVVNGRRWLHSLWGADRFEQLRLLAEADRKTRFETGMSGRIPLVGDFPSAITMDARGAAQYMKIQEQPGRPPMQGTPDLSIESIEKIIEFEPEQFIRHIAPRPLLIITAAGWDMMHPLDQIQNAFAKAGVPKQLVALPCEGNEIYVPPALGQMLDHGVNWYRQYL